MGFNVFEISKNNPYNKKVPLLINETNKAEVLFITDFPYWNGTKIDFTGLNASILYSFLKKNLFLWEIFSSGILSRFDIYFKRLSKAEDSISVLDFLNESHKLVGQTFRNCNVVKNKKGVCLKTGSRKSSKTSRVYEFKNFLKFELEIRNKKIEEYHNFLVSNCFEEFENNLSKEFILYFANNFPLKYCYFDWLVKKIRSMKAKLIINNFLKVNYLVKDPFQYYDKQEQVILFLQLLSFTENLNFTTNNLGSTNYKVFNFKIHDFLKFQNPDFKPTNYYQIKKFLEFLENLPENFSLKNVFSDEEFQKLIIIPKVLVKKCEKRKSLVAHLWVTEDYYLYHHPFLLPDLFKGKCKTDEFKVRFAVFHNFTYQENLEKKFLIEKFIQKYRGKISNQRISNMKKEFIKIIKFMKDHNVIESNYKIISNGQSMVVKELNIQNISEGFIIYEKLKVDF